MPLPTRPPQQLLSEMFRQEKGLWAPKNSKEWKQAWNRIAWKQTGVLMFKDVGLGDSNDDDKLTEK